MLGNHELTKEIATNWKTQALKSNTKSCDYLGLSLDRKISELKMHINVAYTMGILKGVQFLHSGKLKGKGTARSWARKSGPLKNPTDPGQ